MISTVHIRLLGDFVIEQDGRPLRGLGSPRMQSLLSYLLLRRQAPLSRQQLAFLFWPESSEAQAQANLRKLLHQLNHMLPAVGELIVADKLTLHWPIDPPSSLDVAQFEAAVLSAEQAELAGDQSGLLSRLEEAVLLYRGDLVPGCYDDWILPERERLRERFFVVLEQLLLVLESSQDFSRAISYCERLVRYDPLHEASYRRLMSLYAQAGDRAGVIRAYQACTTILRRELNVTPSPATAQHYKQLTATDELGHPPAEPAAAAPGMPRNNLRLQPTSFVGRATELAAALRQLRRQEVRLLTITGPPGIGKTRLAGEVAATLAEEYSDGVFCIGLEQVSEPQLVLPAIYQTLNPPEQQGSSVLERLINFLRPRRLLLILDNFEHLLPAATLIAELLGACPGLKIIATSRGLLSLQGEYELRVPPMSLPASRKPILGEQLRDYEATRLFVERAQLAREDFQVSDSSAQAIAEIVWRLDGLPLAIEWAAARVRYLPPEVMLPRLENRLKLLVNGARDLPARQQSLRNAVAWSYDLLDDRARRLFCRLSLFAGGWTPEAAEMVCFFEGEDGGDMLDELITLADKGLIVQEDAHNGQAPEMRFHMLETIQEYALEQLQASGEYDELRRRHADYYLALENEGRAGTHGPRGERWQARLQRELANIRSAAAWRSGHSPSSRLPAIKP